MYNDKFYGQVKEMLQMEDWEILNDPFTVRIKKLKFAIDLEVRKGNVTALVEIKSFLNKGFLEDFYAARGKYQTYKDALRFTENNTPLFLALPYNTFEKHFTNPL
jgi:predicted nuclease of restriction endonuclease-like RecB superfamily